MKQSHPSDKGPDDVAQVSVSRDFKHASSILVKRFLAMAGEFETNFPGKKLVVTCTYRSPEVQRELYKIGRFNNPGKPVTNCDGFNKKSNHNYYLSRALDVAVCIGGKIIWDESEYWPLVSLAEKHDLVSGGSWEKFQDWPHIELPREDA